MLNYYILGIGSLLWMGILIFFIFTLRPESNSADIKGSRRRCLVLLRSSFIFVYTGYLIIKQDIYGDFDPQNEDIMRYIALTFYCFDILNLPIYLKSKDISMYIHHFISIAILGGLIQYNFAPFYFKYEMMNVEFSVILQSSKDILRSLDRAKTKIALALEFGFTLALILTKIIIRAPLFYCNIFVLDVHVVIKILSFLIQVLYFFWCWKGWQLFRQKLNQGYFDWKHFQNYPWISIHEKLN